MQLIRTLLLLLIAIALTAFIAINWTPVVRVNFWPTADGYAGFDWPVGFVALFFFLLGMVPMWLLHKGAAWRLKRRIGSLENSLKANSFDSPSAIATTTQLDAASNQESPTSPL